MTIEHARAHAIPKLWGVVDRAPWSNAGHNDDGVAIGEIWYERAGSAAPDASLLLKLLFTSQPLSIQVHPGDAYAQSIGLPNGKTEAWYVLSAVPGAKVALGLKQRLTPQQLRRAADDGSISDLVVWRVVRAGDTIFVPAGTIHAIGAGLVIAELQQRSDTTYRLFDHGRGRELHIENAIAVADTGPSDLRVIPTRLTETRTQLVSNAHFGWERIELAPNSAWRMEAKLETWLLVINGRARVGSIDLVAGEAVFAEADCVDMQVGAIGMVGLLGYAGGAPSPHLLECLEQPAATGVEPPLKVRVPSLTRAKPGLTNGHLETTK